MDSILVIESQYSGKEYQVKNPFVMMTGLRGPDACPYAAAKLLGAAVIRGYVKGFNKGAVRSVNGMGRLVRSVSDDTLKSALNTVSKHYCSHVWNALGEIRKTLEEEENDEELKKIDALMDFWNFELESIEHRIKVLRREFK